MPRRRPARRSASRRGTAAAWSRVDRSPETIQIGRQLQQLRARHGWSLADVAERSGISMSTLSRIENNKLSPTMDVVSRLLNGLKIPYHELVFPSQPRRPRGFCVVTPAGKGEKVRFPGLRYELLGAAGDDSPLHAMILTVEARSVAEMGDPSSHEGEEFLYVLSGKVEVHRSGYEPCVLGPGDSMHFDSGIPHVYVARGSQPASLLIVTESPMEHGRVQGAETEK